MQDPINTVKVTSNAILGGIALVGVAAFSVVRAVQASMTAIDGHRAVGEAAIVWIVVLCAVVMLTCQRPRSLGGWAALAAVALSVGASGIFPLWRSSRPDAGVVRLELGAVERERFGPPASTGGRYDVTVTPKQAGPYLVQLDVGSRRVSIEGSPSDSAPKRQTIFLAKNERIRAYLEHRGTAVMVEARPHRLPPRFLQIGAAIAVLLAALADALTSRRRTFGVLTATVASAMVFVVALVEPTQSLGAKQVVGLVLMATMAGVLAGGFFLVATARLRRSRRNQGV